ncbi:MAG: PA4642 family protein [Porticoccaceae bacterium]|jgi:hypothetical protein
MSLKKDKQKVLGEVFDDERIKTFLQFLPPAGVNGDYHLLEKAYRGMKAENFETFVRFFIEAGHDINAKNPEGNTLLAVVSQHRHGEDYAEILKAAGAQ